MPDNIDYQKLAMAMLQAQNPTYKAVSSTPAYAYGFTGGGLFSVPGLDDGVFSALNLPIPGLQAVLPSYSAVDTSPLQAIMTGVTSATGSNPVGVCDDPKTAGLATLCTQTAVFGRYSLMTPVIDLDQIGKIANRGVNRNLTLLNPPQLPASLVPTIPGGNSNFAGVIKSEIAKILAEFAAGWIYEFGKQIYAGNPSNNTSGGGYKEYAGLNKLINTGHVDAITGNLCPAADSFIKDFTSTNISGSAVNATALVNLLTALYRYEILKAKRHGLGDCTWAWCMSDMLFWELCQVWPCIYATSACSTTNTQTAINVIGMDTTQQRDDMYRNKYLLINGIKVFVITDDSIAEVTVNGTDFVSDIYLVPLKVLSNKVVTYFEYYDYEVENGAMMAAKILAPDGIYQTSDGGRFFWHRKPTTNFCVQMLAKTEPRIRCLTTQIAARILNVKYTPSIAAPSPWPGDYTYQSGGGSTNIPTYFSDFVMP